MSVWKPEDDVSKEEIKIRRGVGHRHRPSEWGESIASMGPECRNGSSSQAHLGGKINGSKGKETAARRGFTLALWFKTLSKRHYTQDLL